MLYTKYGEVAAGVTVGWSEIAEDACMTNTSAVFHPGNQRQFVFMCAGFLLNRGGERKVITAGQP